ncbi:MAG: hypothetical protein ACI35P_01050 [Bacillus sp. (in: firmicutes)]
MEHHLAFHIATYTEDDSTFPKPLNGNYNYWTALIKYYLSKADTVDIHCWNEEVETIEEIALLHKQTMNITYEENMTIFQGNVTSSLKEYLLYSNLNICGGLKWFAVHLDKGKESVFQSGHWGTEFFVPNVLEEEIAVIKKIVPDETEFHPFS